MKNRKSLNSPRLSELKKRRKKDILLKALFTFLGLVALFSLGAYLSRMPGLNIKEVSVEGSKIVDADILESKVKEELAGKYLWLFPRSNVLIYPKGNIEEKLRTEFPRLKEIKMSPREKGMLSITVSEREAKYMWCGEAMPAEPASEENCYFMDEEGYIFGEAPYFSGEIYFKFYGIAVGLMESKTPIGNRFSEASWVGLLRFKDTLVSLGLKPVIMNLLPNQDVELYLGRGSGKALGPKIMFRSGDDFENVAENLQTALSTEPLMSGFKNKYSLLQYIDLRFGNKVYFKFNE